MQCISEWSTAQLAINSALKSLACPLCKQPYTLVLHDCRSNFFRRKEYIKGAESRGGGGSSDFHPSAYQLRRRSIYYSATPASSHRHISAPGPPGKTEVSLTLLNRPEVSSWVDRELQALLLDDDLSIVAQHILGSLRAAFPAPIKRSPMSSQAITVSRDKCIEVTAAAAAAYLQDSAGRFASELWSFVASGLSMQAHDRLVFGAGDTAARQRSAGALMSAAGIEATFVLMAGQNREEGELSEEEPQRQPSDDLQLSLSYHSGGCDSEDSEAYIPLVKSALQSTGTSRNADIAASHQHREGQSADDVSHSEGAASQPVEDGNHPSEAAKSGGAADVAHHSTSANGHADGAEADDEGDAGLKGAGQQLLDGSMHSLSSARDDAGAHTGQSGKKRKGRGKKGRSRAAKKQAEPDRKAAASGEEGGDLGKAEAEPCSGVGGEQSLTRLREAALTWARKARAQSSQ